MTETIIADTPQEDVGYGSRNWVVPTPGKYKDVSLYSISCFKTLQMLSMNTFTKYSDLFSQFHIFKIYSTAFQLTQTYVYQFKSDGLLSILTLNIDINYIRPMLSL